MNIIYKAKIAPNKSTIMKQESIYDIAINSLNGQPISLKEFEGKKIPKSAHLIVNDQEFLMNVKNSKYSYTFPSINKETNFSVKAAGFSSINKKLIVIDRPQLSNLKIHAKTPAYTKLKNIVYKNIYRLRFFQKSKTKS